MSGRLVYNKNYNFCIYMHMSSPAVFSGVRVIRSSVVYGCFVDLCLSFCNFSFGHCVVCSSSIYGFWIFFKLFFPLLSVLFSLLIYLFITTSKLDPNSSTSFSSCSHLLLYLWVVFVSIIYLQIKYYHFIYWSLNPCYIFMIFVS